MKIYNITGMRYCENSTDGVLLTETTQAIDIPEIIEYDGKNYAVCRISVVDDTCAVREVNFVEEGEEDEQYGDKFTCPYCTREYRDADCELSEGGGDIKCPYCHSELEYTKDIEIVYSVSPVKKVSVKKI